MTKYPDLLPRVLAALAGAIVIVAGIIYGPWTYLMVFLVICGVALWEFYGLITTKESHPAKFWGILMSVGLVGISYLVISEKIPGVWLLTLAPIGFIIFTIKLYDKQDHLPFVGIANTWLGVVYLALPFTLMHFIAFAPDYYDFQLVLGCLLLHWAHDVGAYFAGVRFGRTPLFERWSPKKSWEGSVGGALTAVIVAVAGARWADSLELWQWLVMTFIIVTAGTLGDLVESQFKRSLAIKDSGHSIPGHGGFLDRFDGLLLSTPLVAAFLQFLFA